MGYPKGSISLSPVQDIPLLLQVLHSQFITHGQLREFMRLGCYDMNSTTIRSTGACAGWSSTASSYGSASRQ